MASPWEQHVEVFLDASAGAERHAAALRGVTDALSSSNKMMLDLVTSLNAVITGEDTTRRARAVLLLAEVLSVRLPEECAVPARAEALCGFFASKLSDWPALQGALTGIRALLRGRLADGTSPALPATAARAAADALFAITPVQSLAVANRILWIECAAALAEQHPAAPRALGQTFLEGLAGALDGEKDPRCLHVAFSLWPAIPALFPESDPDGFRLFEDAAEELFDNVSCYFPLAFTPPRDDPRGITREALSTGLERSMLASPLFVSLALPLAEQTLREAEKLKADAAVDALRMAAAAAAASAPAELAEAAGDLYRSLRSLIVPAASSSGETPAKPLAGQAEATLASLLRSLSKSPKAARTVIESILGDLSVTDMSAALRGPPPGSSSALSRAASACEAASRLLSAAAASSVSAAVSVFESVGDAALSAAAAASGGGAEDEESGFDRRPLAVLVLARVAAAAAGAAGGAAEAAGAGAGNASIPSPFGRHEAALLDCFSRTVGYSAAAAPGEGAGPAAAAAAAAEAAVIGLGAFLSLPEAVPAASRAARGGAAAALAQAAVFSARSPEEADGVRKAAASALASFAAAQTRAGGAGAGGAEAAEAATVALVSAALSGNPADWETKSSRGHAALAALATVLPAFPPARRASLCAPLAAACAAALPGVLCGRGAAAHSAQLSALYSHALPPPAAAAAAGGGTDVPDSVWGAFVSAALDAGEAAPSVERWWAEDEASSGGGAAAVPAEALSAAAAACCAAMAACGAAQQETLAARAAGGVRSGSLPAGRGALACGVLCGLQKGVNAGAQPRDLIAALLRRATDTSAPPQEREAAAAAAAAVANKAAADGDAASLAAFQEVLSPPLLSQSGSAGAAAAVATGWLATGLAMRGSPAAASVALPLLALLPHPDCGAPAAAAAAEALGRPLRGPAPLLSRRTHAAQKPLAEQRFFTAVLPPVLEALRGCGAGPARGRLCAALAWVLSGAPRGPLLSQLPLLAPLLPDALSALVQAAASGGATATAAASSPPSALLRGLLGVVGDALTEPQGRAALEAAAGPLLAAVCAAAEGAPAAQGREAALQVLLAAASLEHRRIFPYRVDVLKTLRKAVGDRKRTVRAQAVQCREMWLSAVPAAD